MEKKSASGTSSKALKTSRAQPYSAENRGKGKNYISDSSSRGEEEDSGLFTEVKRKKTQKYARKMTSPNMLSPGKAKEGMELDIDSEISSDHTETDQELENRIFILPKDATPKASNQDKERINIMREEKAVPIIQRITKKIERPQSFALTVEHKQTPGKGLPEKYSKIRNSLATVKEFCKVITPANEKGKFKIIFTSRQAAEQGIKTLNKQEIPNTPWIPGGLEEKKKKKIIVKEIPIGTLESEVKTAFEEFGNIQEFHMQIVGIWQKAKITFSKEAEAIEASRKWSTLIGKDAVRIIPAYDPAETLRKRQKATLKLTELPKGCTAFDLWDHIIEAGGKTCKIPRNPGSYQ